jgi:hypothetical protein
MKTRSVLTGSIGLWLAALLSARGQIAFTRGTTGTIVTDVGTGVAAAWGDYDDNGFLDLVITSTYNFTSNLAQKNSLYRNDGNGNFVKITNTAITAEARDWRGASWADYNNDGNLDLFVTSNDGFGFAAQNELFRNNGGGTFTKMTPKSVGDITSLAAGNPRQQNR